MADNNIVIKLTAESNLDELQQQLKTQLKIADEYAKKMADLTIREQESIAQIKEQVKNEEKLKKALADNAQAIEAERKALQADIDTANKNIQALRNEISARSKSIEALKKNTQATNIMDNANKRAALRLREMREELMKMEDAGEFGTNAYIELSIAAGQLEDQIGDVQQRIRILASDTKEIDAVMGLGDGLAGTFYIATSAAEVFGEDMEGLQKAFYKVQAAMSILSGTQQVYNALQKNSAAAVVFGTAVEKLAAKSKDQQTASLTRNTKAWFLNGAASAGASLKTVALTVVTKAATIAQAALNAVIYANPFVLLGAAIAVAVAAIVGFVKWNSKGAQAARAFNEANKKLEEDEAKAAVGEAKRNHDRQEQIKATNAAEENALTEAKKRNASELEMAQIRSSYAKRRFDETSKYVTAEQKANKTLMNDAYDAMEAKRKEANEYKEGSKKKKKALEELAEAERKYYEYVEKDSELQHQYLDDQKAAADAEQEVVEQRKQMRVQAEQANIDLMREGAAKEIAQINLNYREQLKQYQGNSAEETAMRKALLEKQAKELEKVRKKYALEAQQTAIQEQKNLLAAMSQSGGTESDYAQQIELTKRIAEAEAQARVEALDKETMSDEEYAAQVEAIRLDLQRTLKEIDDQEVERKNENAKRLTDIALQEAEAEKNALTGAEGVDKQKEVWDNYYAARANQIEENARIEKEAVQRSTDSEEVKAAKITQIDNQLKADLTQNAKDAAQARLGVDEQYLTDLQIAADKAQHEVDKGGTAGQRIEALKANLEAQNALYDEQARQLKSKYEAGLITYQEYKEQEWEITKAIADNEVTYITEKMQVIGEAFQETLNYMQQASDLVFESLQSQVQAEMDALDEEYTTDAEEAKKNANKKYITEEEMEKKKAALQKKQQKYAKAQALINAGINTALSVTNALTTSPFPLGLIMASLAAAMGAAQIAVIASKPLAQYAKGRKGGQGEYAVVGERGAELMYIPKGASIVPHDKMNDQNAWAAYGVPRLEIPALPSISDDTMHYAAEQTAIGLSIDYDKLGEAVARNIPSQKAVHVNVDRSGITVLDGLDTHRYLNQKYTGTWN